MNFHKYFSWKNELLFNHGFRLGSDVIEYGDAEIMVKYVKKNPLSTNNIILSSYLTGYIFNRNRNKLSVGLGVTGRYNLDKSNFYYGIDEKDPVTGEFRMLNYHYEKNQNHTLVGD